MKKLYKKIIIDSSWTVPNKNCVKKGTYVFKKCCIEATLEEFSIRVIATRWYPFLLLFGVLFLSISLFPLWL